MKIIDSLILYSFCVFLLLGNFPRIIDFPMFKDAQNILELCLYLINIFFLPVYLLHMKRKERLFYYYIVLFYLIFYFFPYFFHVFFVYNNFSIGPFLYNIRIFFLLTISFTIGHIYNSRLVSIEKLISFLNGIFIFWIVIAWIIFIFFHKSSYLWGFLGKLGIKFLGDPHINRLVGILFDPNYFGNLLLFVVFINLFAFKNFLDSNYLFMSIFSFLSMLFTFSRSSMLGFLVIILYFILINIMKFRIAIHKIYMKFILYISIICVLIYVAFYNLINEKLFLRIMNVMNDPSAHHRFKDMKIAISLLSDFKIFCFGIGYNYIKELGYTTQLGSFDSSLFSTLVCLGLFLTMIMLFVITIFLKNMEINLKKNNLQMEYNFLRLVLYPYLISSLVICNFNNLLYYPFYLLLILPILFSFYMKTKRELTSDGA